MKNLINPRKLGQEFDHKVYDACKLDEAFVE